MERININTLEYIRKRYDVPAKRGARVRFTGGAKPQEGTIKGARNARLMVLLDGDKHSGPMHPTWEMTYL